jgi:heat shock protein HslJ
MDGSPIASGTNVTIGFGLAQASGFSGCNQYTAGYQTGRQSRTQLQRRCRHAHGL